MGLYAAVLSGPSQAADSSGESSAAGSSTAAKPRPVWHGTKSLALTPNNPIPRERVRLRGKVAKPARARDLVRVQVKRSGKSWQTVDKDRSISRKGNWTARFRAPSKKTPLAVRSQVLDPRGRVVSTSKPQHLRMTKLRVSVTLPDEIAADEPSQAIVRISPPARPLRRPPGPVPARPRRRSPARPDQLVHSRLRCRTGAGGWRALHHHSDQDPVAFPTIWPGSDCSLEFLNLGWSSVRTATFPRRPHRRHGHGDTTVPHRRDTTPTPTSTPTPLRRRPPR